uniref:GBD/FH3 domain-containing protein n=2 Tax=Anopheles funestus TaxID=62324 RepID=A0A4Y0BWA1_ANOFN
MGNIMSSSDSTLPRQQTRNGSERYRTTTPREHMDYTSTKRCYFEDEVSSQQNSPEPCHNRQQSPNAESSRMLFLLYLIHRTWNVVVDSVDQKGKKARLELPASGNSRAPKCLYDDDFDSDLNLTDLDDQSSMYGSQYTFCTCSYCEEESERDNYNNISGNRFSFCESDLSYCLYQMAPSAGKSPPGGTQIGPPDTNDASLGWNANVKENQRPPVFNPEDYVISLKKYGRRGSNGNFKSIYDTTINEDAAKQDKSNDNVRSQTLPHKNSDYRSPIPAPPEMDAEMSLRQFGSVTDLLTKLRADLRASFPSFVQEFVSSPLDGVSLLLEVLRAVQLSQSAPMNGTTTMPPGGMARNNQSYQRRALLDELACLQCLSICCTRSPEAGTRLGTTPIGLLPLAAAATGTGIRSRIVALQLLTIACDKSALGDGTQRLQLHGHTAVSEALSTLRLRCAEPVRFRLLVGMLNSGGGSGELQAIGMRFINTFLESSENIQTRLYLQAELFQAGLDPSQMCKTISSTSPWLERLRLEVKRWDAIRIDIEQLQHQARSAEQVRSRLVILERRVQILHEEKTVLTTMERRLQERCAELQREVLRLKGTGSNNSTGSKAHESSNSSSLEKRPVALPRQVPPQTKRNNTSENDDEGISSSETGQSSTPEPPRLYPAKNGGSSAGSHKFSISLTQESTVPMHELNGNGEDDTNATIEDVIEELQNIVNDAEREISDQNEILFQQVDGIPEQALYSLEISNEHEIVPVNLLPQPPRKSRSLAHLISNPSDGEGSGYDLMMVNNETKVDFFDDDEDAGVGKAKHPFGEENGTGRYFDIAATAASMEVPQESHANVIPGPDVIHSTAEAVTTSVTAMHHSGSRHPSTKDSNRAILNVIMDARDKESRLLRAQSLEREQHISQAATPQQFNGVFFMTDMNSAGKYPKPDITAALEAKKVTKNLDRMGAYGVDSMINIVMTNEQRLNKANAYAKSRMAAAAGPPNPANGAIPSKLTGNNNFKLRPNTGTVHQPTFTIGTGMVREASRSQTNIGGSKVTDLPSGLY